jgi:hypothetical protein
VRPAAARNGQSLCASISAAPPRSSVPAGTDGACPSSMAASAGRSANIVGAVSRHRGGGPDAHAASSADASQWWSSLRCG